MAGAGKRNAVSFFEKSIKDVCLKNGCHAYIIDTDIFSFTLYRLVHMFR